MEILLNDESLHGQYGDRLAFETSLVRVMKMRALAGRFERDVHCHSAILDRNVVGGVSLRRAIGALPHDRRRAVMSWLTKGGPFWSSQRRHGEADYLESMGVVVTDSAVAEAAFRKLHGGECGLISFSPSDWTRAPIGVLWRRGAEGLDDESVSVENYWTVADLEERLGRADAPIRSWHRLQLVAERRFARLTFGDECFRPLRSLPFRGAAAIRVLELLGILDRLAAAFDSDGRRTAEGHGIYREHFTGDRAAFSDSSFTEKQDFGSKLRFPHPDHPGQFLECTWHGKVSTMTLRMHFSWPIRHERPVYVMYVGQKITRR